MIIDNELLLNQERLGCLCIRAVIAHLLASRFLGPGRKFKCFLNLKFLLGGLILLNALIIMS